VVGSINKVYKVFVIALSAAVLLAGCGGGVAAAIENQYPLESVVEGEAGSTSKVYRVANQTVPEVAKTLAKQDKPKETSKEDPERMFLVYDNQLVHLMRDIEAPEDTLVEISNKEFVRRHYNTSFLEAYLMYSVVSNLFGMGGIRRDQGYGGYIDTSGRYSRNAGNTGSIRYGSIGGNSPRGGGPGVGK
jgi:hypothetical protein